MLEKTENKDSFIFRGCERHDTGWPKSFAERGTRKPVYLQQFGRAMRPKPELKIRDFDCQAWILEEQSARLPKDDVLIPDIDDPDHPAWNDWTWSGEEFVFEPEAIPDCNNPMAEPVYDPVANNPAAFTLEQILAGAGKPWYVPESLPYPKGSYRAENHSLNDGNRDSRWAKLDRSA